MQETITWHKLPELPDDGIEILIQTTSKSHPIWAGYYDSESECFRWSDGSAIANMKVEVIAWADMPAGVQTDAA